jgi:tetratricopeptide (TPR) repeat protein
MKRCPACHNEFEDEYRFCQKDGIALIVVAQPYAHGTAAAPARIADAVTNEIPLDQPLRSKNEETTAQVTSASVIARYRVAISVALAVMVLIAIAAIIFLGSSSAKQSIMAEISKGNLVNTGGTSAYDLFVKYKSELKANDLMDIGNKVMPPLENRGNQVLTRLKQDASESQSEWAEVIRLYSWLNELRPSPQYESKKYFSQARQAFLNKDYNGAITYYKSSIQLDSSWALPFNGLGRAYIGAKDKLTARENYQRATEIEPEWIYPWINLGALYIDINDPVSAEQSLKRAIEIDPRKPSAHYLLAQALEKLGRKCEALAEYQITLEKASNVSDPGFNVDVLRKRISELNC